MLEERIVVEPFFLFFSSYKRYDASGEIHGKTKVVNYNLWTVWVGYRIHACKGFAKGCYLGSLIIEAVADGIELTFSNKWFVTLYVDDDIPVAANFLNSFLNAVGAALVVRTCHDRLAAKSYYGIIDAGVVGCYISFLQSSGNFFINMLDDRLVAQHSQRLAWKSC